MVNTANIRENVQKGNENSRKMLKKILPPIQSPLWPPNCIDNSRKETKSKRNVNEQRAEN